VHAIDTVSHLSSCNSKRQLQYLAIRLFCQFPHPHDAVVNTKRRGKKVNKGLFNDGRHPITKQPSKNYKTNDTIANYRRKKYRAYGVE